MENIRNIWISTAAEVQELKKTNNNFAELESLRI